MNLEFIIIGQFGNSSSYFSYMYYTTCVKLFLLSISLLQRSGMCNAAE